MTFYSYLNTNIGEESLSIMRKKGFITLKTFQSFTTYKQIYNLVATGGLLKKTAIKVIAEESKIPKRQVSKIVRFMEQEFLTDKPAANVS